MAATLNPTDGFIFHGWMVTDLHLEGSELIVFALVHQFSQSRAGVYTGGVSYLRAWTGWSDNTCRRHLRALVDKGILKEIRGEVNRVPFCNYELSEDTLQILRGTPQKLQGGTSKFEGGIPQNLRGDNKEENIINNSLSISAREKFRKPTVAEVDAYCRERGNNINAQAFVDFYESKGWRVGSQPMKDWKAAVRTWEQRHSSTPTPSPRRASSQVAGDPNTFWNR